MHTPHKPLTVALATAHYWLKQGDRFAAVYEDRPEWLSTPYCQAEFDAVDRRLYSLLCDGSDNEPIWGDGIRIGLAFWQTPPMQMALVSRSLHIPLRNYYVDAVARLAYQEGTMHAHVDVWLYLTSKTTSGDLYAYGKTLTPMATPVMWLEEHYPGWLQRYRHAVDLGVDDKLLVTSVLTSSVPAVTVSFQDVTFD